MVRQDIDIKACAAGEKGEAGNSAAHQSAGAGDIIVGPFIAWQISATHHHSEGIGIRIDWWARRLLSLRSASRYQKHCRKCRYTRGKLVIPGRGFFEHDTLDRPDDHQVTEHRSEERRVGKAGVSTCRYTGSPYH